MMTQEESKIPKRISSNPVGDENRVYVRNNGETDQSQGSMFSPRFKSVVAMAGWDEEALLLASLVVEDTPERDKDAKNNNKRSEMLFKTPPSNLRRKKRVQRRSPVVNPVTVLNLDDDNNGENSNKEGEIEKQRKTQADQNDAKKLLVEEVKQLSGQSGGASCSCSTLLNMEKLREELSCAICLELCFEPSTTPCGHSFCKKCLRSAADKCGKRCPKCRQLISNGRLCTVNTVLWNTIQLLFPIEVETREAAGALTGAKAERQRPTPIQTAMRVTQHDHGQRPTPIPTGMRVTHHYDGHHRSTRLMWPSGLSRNVQRGEDYANAFRNSARRNGGGGGRRAVASQEDDAALALRLQREEFMTEYTEGRSGVSDEQHRNSTSLARANLRAMASRAINIRLRNRAM